MLAERGHSAPPIFTHCHLPALGLLAGVHGNGTCSRVAYAPKVTSQRSHAGRRIYFRHVSRLVLAFACSLVPETYVNYSGILWSPDGIEVSVAFGGKTKGRIRPRLRTIELYLCTYHWGTSTLSSSRNHLPFLSIRSTRDMLAVHLFLRDAEFGSGHASQAQLSSQFKQCIAGSLL